MVPCSQYKQRRNVDIIMTKIMTMMILVMIIIMVIIIATMITMIKMILIIAVVMIIKAQFNQVIFPRAPPLKPRVLLKPQNSTTKKAKSI